MSTLDLESSSNKDIKSVRLSTAGKILVTVTGGFGILITVVCAPFVSPALRKICLPYIPATTTQVENIFNALKNRTGSLIDLGSGDGRIVIEAAKRNFEAHGVELNPWLVLYSKFSSIRNRKRAKFFYKDLWKFNLSKYDNIVIFGVEQMMSDLETKILKECNRDSVIVACRFPLPNLKPITIVGHGIDTVWMYTLKKQIS